MNTTKSFTEREASVRARGIMYQCRMKFLRSRESAKQQHQNHHPLHYPTSSSSSLSVLSSGAGATALPCPVEKLIPPTELMTRAQSFRFAYVKHFPHNADGQIRRMMSLTKKEDPMVTKKRGEILERVRTAEMKMRERHQSSKRVGVGTG
eukprot:CAMPEP_0172495766 /NCGR_PEP_ID=MMETSP1066-20121228/76316_1 /TAXON_ID=671091 /ORGANISM="Coscinodiscus wailesii, Strain CCMP2513" /LENGTH=149 /DNA_ID=CAMNT_0013267663 /DNA_START=346 /DNA_END=791 /DNA_ORIENTATION=-